MGMIVYRWGSHASGTRSESSQQVPSYVRKLRDEWNWPHQRFYFGHDADARSETDDRKRRAIRDDPRYQAALEAARVEDQQRRRAAPQLSNPFHPGRAQKQ